MNTLAQGLIGGLMLAVATSASAFPVDVTSIEGVFNAATGTTVSGEGTNSIRWGTSTGYGQSGYDFDGFSPLPSTINDDTPFVLGTFTHINRPITGDTLTGVDLAVTMGFAASGDASNASGSFVFSHDETLNNAPEIVGSKWVCTRYFLFWCKAGYRKDIVNNTGDVDDIVSFDDFFATSSEFQLGNNIYSLDLVGFDGGLDEFFTAENAVNSIDLLAKLNVRAAEVPEPGTLALFGLGLLGLGMAHRRKT
jgi:hypothetical protein